MCSCYVLLSLSNMRVSVRSAIQVQLMGARVTQKLKLEHDSHCSLVSQACRVWCVLIWTIPSKTHPGKKGSHLRSPRPVLLLQKALSDDAKYEIYYVLSDYLVQSDSAWRRWDMDHTRLIDWLIFISRELRNGHASPSGILPFIIQHSLCSIHSANMLGK